MSLDLILRRTTSEHGPEWDRDKFWDVYCDGLYLGSLAQQMGRSDEPPSWQWSIQLHAGRFGNGVKPRSGQAATRDEAMQAFRAAWDVLRPAIGDEGWALHVEHMRRRG